MQAELLLHPQWIIPVDAADGILTNHSLAVTGGGIQALPPTPEARADIRAVREIELPGHALIPGLINAHTHAPTTLLRGGLADDLPLMTWLHGHIWPAERRWVDPEFVRAGTRLAALEMLESGTICFNDMYFFAEVTAKVAADAGMRAVAGMILVDFPTRFADAPEEYLRKGLDLHDRYRDHALIRTAFAPHAPYSVPDVSWECVRTLSDELDVPVHIHLHETHDEIVQFPARLRRTALGPAGASGSAGTEPGRGAHDAARRLGDRGPGPRQRPCGPLPGVESEACRRILSGGPVLGGGRERRLGHRRSGQQQRPGHDGRGPDRGAADQGRSRLPRAALPAYAALRMATLNGARALGIDAETGSLETGKSADIVALDLRAPNTQPVYNPVSQIVYAAGRDQVRQVWVAGRQLIRDGASTTLDSAAILDEAREMGGADRRGRLIRTPACRCRVGFPVGTGNGL